jgi:hypothetical protein
MNITGDKLWEMLEIRNIPVCLMKVVANTYNVSDSQIQESFWGAVNRNSIFRMFLLQLNTHIRKILLRLTAPQKDCNNRRNRMQPLKIKITNSK